MPPPTVTCILGMRRSGTSLAAGVLHSLGVDLGHEEHLAGPAPDNPKGFREHRWIVKLNDQILERLGGS
ncbi:MAG TPA: hypothetical protein VE714_05115, partial [Gemmatimonadales bacterium]|nr:hypothetical protein [Gemmatimonadales bacterium]